MKPFLLFSAATSFYFMELVGVCMFTDDPLDYLAVTVAGAEAVPLLFLAAVATAFPGVFGKGRP